MVCLVKEMNKKKKKEKSKRREREVVKISELGGGINKIKISMKESYFNKEVKITNKYLKKRQRGRERKKEGGK